MKRLGAILGSVLVGAFAGGVVMGTILLVANSRFGFGSLDDPADFARTVYLSIGGAAVAGSCVAYFFGSMRLVGRVGNACKGAAFGALAGVVAGPPLVTLVGAVIDMPSKEAWFLGMLVGVPLGSACGCVIGLIMPHALQGEEPLPSVCDVSDRELNEGLPK